MYHLHIGGKTERYASSQEAGKAFYKADVEQNPSVTIKNGTEEITIADTYKSSIIDGEEYKLRRLNKGAKEEEGFVSGYYDELEKSLNTKMKMVDWGEVMPEKEGHVPKLDARMYEDLSQLAQRDAKKAESIWEKFAPKEAPKPAIVDSAWNKRKEGIKETSAALENVDKKEPMEEKEAGSWNNFIEPEEAKERARKNRDREMQVEKNRLGAKAEVKRQDVEELTETAKAEDKENRESERLNQTTNFQKQAQTEKEKERQIVLMEQVHKQFHSTGNKFLYKDHKRDVAFKDKESKLVTNSNDDRVAKAMATVAAAKGWKTIKVTGHPDFQREVWLAGSLHGIEVRGYTPTERDMKLAEKAQERSMKNQVAHDKGRGGTQGKDYSRDAGNDGSKHRESTTEGRTGLYSGSLVDHGSAPYKNDPKEKDSYFVTIETEQGRRTIWGKDLKRSFEGNKSVKPGDQLNLTYQGKKPVEVVANVKDEKGKIVGQENIQAHRNAWEVKTDEGKIIQGVSDSKIQQAFNDPAKRQAAANAVNKEIVNREQNNTVPKVTMYDHTAPAHVQQQERGVERQPDKEQTR